MTDRNALEACRVNVSDGLVLRRRLNVDTV